MFVMIEPETGTDLANSPRTKLYMRTSTINNNSISPTTMLTVRVKLDWVIKNLVEWGMKEQLTITTERVDDIALLVACS